MRFSGKCVVITGAASGIGRAATLLFAREGAQVFAAEGADHSICERAAEGMGFSLACAVAATREASGWLVALGDMPKVQASTMQAVLRALESGASIVIPCHEGRRGHPVGFSAEHRAALLALTGDEGARRVVGANAESVLELAVDDPGVLADVDTPEDLRRLELDPGTANA